MDGNGDSARVAPGRAWIAGGVLFLASVVVGAGLQPVFPTYAGGTIVATLLFSAALVVLALGVGGRGSVTARRPLGTVAMCALAVWTPAVAVVQQLAGVWLISTGSSMVYGYVTALVQFVLALVVVVQIVRARVVPKPWVWSPAGVLAAMAALWLVEQLPVVADPAVASVLLSLEGLVRTAAPILYGVVAISFAGRVPAAPPESRVAHPTRTRRVSS